MILMPFPLWNIRKSITLTKIRTICILILCHCCLCLLTLTNDYADCYTDLFFHGHVISTRSFSSFSSLFQKASCSLMRTSLGTNASYTVAAFFKTFKITRCLNNLLQKKRSRALHNFQLCVHRALCFHQHSDTTID